MQCLRQGNSEQEFLNHVHVMYSSLNSRNVESMSINILTK